MERERQREREEVGEKEKGREEGERINGEGSVSEMSISIRFIGNYFWCQMNFQTEALPVGCSALLSYKVHFQVDHVPRTP